MKITLLKVDGSKEDLKDQTLETLQKAVEGYIELVKVRGGQLWVNEEGRIHNLLFNRQASEVANQPIFGNAVYITKTKKGE